MNVMVTTREGVYLVPPAVAERIRRRERENVMVATREGVYLVPPDVAARIRSRLGEPK